MKPACRSSAGPRAEATIRTPLIRPVQHPAGIPNSGGVECLVYTSGSGFRAEALGKIKRDVRPAFFPGRSSWTSATGDTRFCLHKPVPLSRLRCYLLLSRNRECENLGGSYRETNELIYRGAV